MGNYGIKCCYKCSERYIGCHGKCGKYIEERAKFDDRNSKIEAVRATFKVVNDYEVEQAYRKKYKK